MPCKIKGIEFPFTFKSSYEIQPGSVPGPGGWYGQYTCDKCGWRALHQVFGEFWIGEQERLFHQLIQDLDFHSRRCKDVV